jgi:hypothetical protein
MARGSPDVIGDWGGRARRRMVGLVWLVCARREGRERRGICRRCASQGE